MQAIFGVTIPFFGLVLCGYLAARSRVLPASAIPGLNAFVLFFALPCMLFRFGSSLPVSQVLNPSVAIVYLAAMPIMVLGTIWLTRSARLSNRDAAFGAMTAAYTNTGFMGVPMLAALFGPAAAGVVITTLLVDMLVTSSLCIGLSEAEGDDGARIQRERTAVVRALRGAVTNPLPWAIGLGMVFSALSLALPGPLDAIVRMLGDAATPVALFVIGTILWRAGQHVHTRTPVAQFLPVALLKLLVHPLLVLGIGSLAVWLGAPLSHFDLTIVVLAAALPSASSVALLAERYGADTGRITRIIVSSTALAFVSFSSFAWLARSL